VNDELNQSLDVEPFFPELLILTYSCPLAWDEMTGNNAIRHCKQCSLNVRNISHAAEADVEDIFVRARSGERVCVRSECLGAGATKQNKSLRLGLVAATSIVIAWVIGMLRTLCSLRTQNAQI
jgi:hypothetical protein